jgi:hypothetical protein
VIGSCVISLTGLAFAKSPHPLNTGKISRVEDPAKTKGSGDGVYGRFNGDFSYRLSLGAEFDLGTDTVRLLTLAELVTYQTLGLYGSFGEALSPNDPETRHVSFGLSLTPLFLWRWSRARETGYSVWDLTLDSFGLAGGLRLTQPQGGSFANDLGLELGAVLGAPLLARANGPWLRVRANLLTGRGSLQDNGSLGAALWVYLTWEGFFEVGILPEN